MTPYWQAPDGAVTLHLGDCLDVLAGVPDASIDAVITDPPYGLADLSTGLVTKAIAAWLAGDRAFVPAGRGFMGRDWDRFVPPPAAWDQCLRVLKPGGHLLAFAGTRTVDLMTLSVRLAGFEIRESLEWIYGSGMPKSLDVSKAIDKAAGAERGVTAEGMRFGRGSHGNRTRVEQGYRPTELRPEGGVAMITAPATDEAAQWAGWGTGLKPSHEPIVLARKPLAGTVARNVVAHGTGALNIDGCRVEHASDADRAESEAKNQHTRYDNRSERLGGGGIYGDAGPERPDYDGSAGRWPPNVLLTHSAACVLLGVREVRSDGHHPGARGAGGISTTGHAGQDGLQERRSGTETAEAWDCAPGCPVAELDRQSGVTASTGGVGTGTLGARVYGRYANDVIAANAGGLGDRGGASRFFPVFRYQAKAPASARPRLADGTTHVTVKPVPLLQWLARLVTPPGGTVLDPFAGSGSTAEACLIEGFRCVLVERDPQSAELTRERLRKDIQPDMFGGAA